MPARTLIAMALVLPLFAAPRPASAEVVASNAEINTVGNVTRFALDLSGETRARIFVVDGPPRLVIDFDGVTFDIDEPPTSGGVIAAWRFGALSQEAARIVFDLAEPALVTRRAVLPALAGRDSRLVMDIEPADAARFTRAAATATATVAPGTFTPPPAPGDKVVVIDPGHGGVDPGAVADGITEKTLVLDFAKRLERELQGVPGLTVKLTRTDDTFLSLARRIRLARAYGADLFISIHADAAPQNYVRGATVYTLSERPSDAQAAALAARENLADAVSGAIEPTRKEDVSGILADLMRRETRGNSVEFARGLVATLQRAVDVNSNPHRSARFRVLMAHDIPSVLLELGYLTNESDTKSLASTEWQAAAARAVANAIAAFFEANHEDAPNAGVPLDAAAAPSE